MTLVWNAAGVVFIPAGDWFDANLIKTGKGWGEVRGRNGTIQAFPAIQFTLDPRNPPAGGGTALNATAFTADGVYDPSGAIALSSGAFKYARVGWNVTVPNGVIASMAVTGVIQLGRGA